jgi:hypothetical protein
MLLADRIRSDQGHDLGTVVLVTYTPRVTLNPPPPNSQPAIGAGHRDSARNWVLPLSAATSEGQLYL